MRVAYLTGRGWRDMAFPDGALPAPERATFDLLAPAAAAHGLTLTVHPWDAPDLAAHCDAALIRSCWDYIGQPERFIAALEALEAAGVTVLNPASVVRWNARKAYLQALDAAGVPVIETLWSDRLDAHQVARAFETFDAAEIVLKPQVGAGSVRTVRLKRNAWSEASLIDAPDGPALIQPFYPAIEAEGEASLFFAGGEETHAVRKRPPVGGWFANALDARFEAMSPDAAQRNVARQALAAAPPELLYARVDLVAAPGGGVAGDRAGSD